MAEPTLERVVPCDHAPHHVIFPQDVVRCLGGEAVTLFRRAQFGRKKSKSKTTPKARKQLKSKGKAVSKTKVNAKAKTKKAKKKKA